MKKAEIIINEISYDKQIKVTKEILDKIKVGDIITSGWSEAYYGSDSQIDAHYYFNVQRERDENEEEIKKRLKKEKEMTSIWESLP